MRQPSEQSWSLPPWLGFVLPLPLVWFWQRLRQSRRKRFAVPSMSESWLQQLDVERGKRGEDQP